jgi:hypothetical protein
MPWNSGRRFNIVKKYIDQEKVINDIRTQTVVIPKECHISPDLFLGMTMRCDQIIDLIEREESQDEEPIVRCGEGCSHYKRHLNENGGIDCLYSGMKDIVIGFSFCSMGQHKETEKLVTMPNLSIEKMNELYDSTINSIASAMGQNLDDTMKEILIDNGINPDDPEDIRKHVLFMTRKPPYEGDGKTICIDGVPVGDIIYETAYDVEKNRCILVMRYVPAKEKTEHDEE